MRFLAHEIFPRAAVAALQAAGHDVVWIRIDTPGAADRDVPAWAAREERILLTFDKDFGELARGAALPPTCGVVLVRIPMPKADEAGERLAALISAGDDWAGCLSVVERGRVRMRSRKAERPNAGLLVGTGIIARSSATSGSPTRIAIDASGRKR